MSNKQPEFLVKGYHYTEYIEESNSQKLCIDNIMDPSFSTKENDIDFKLELSSSYNTDYVLKQNNTTEIITEDMDLENNDPLQWSFSPVNLKKNSLIHIHRDENSENYFFNKDWQNFEFNHLNGNNWNESVFSSVPNYSSSKINIAYKNATSIPTITYESVTDFTLCLKGIEKFYFQSDISNIKVDQFKKIKSLWFTPHQDDEILTLGYGILQDIEEGYDVHIILCTDGSSTNVLEKWQSGAKCSICNTTHSIGHDFTREEFSKYRDFEFVNSCLHLGIKSENIHILGVGKDYIDLSELNFINQNNDIIIYNENQNNEYYRLKDGGLGRGYKNENGNVIPILENRGINNAEKIVRNFIDMIIDDPNEQFALRCMHPINSGNIQHKDHTGLGLGVLNVSKENNYKNNIINLKTFVEYYVYDQLSDKTNFTQLYNDKYIKQLHEARQSYMKIDWEQGYHGVGYHSVPSYLNNNEKDNLYYIYNGEY